MKQTTFRFVVEFGSTDPAGDLRTLPGLISEVPNVERVDAGPITERCPVSEIHVHMQFEDGTGAERLLDRISRLIARYPDASLWRRERTLSDY